MPTIKSSVIFLIGACLLTVSTLCISQSEQSKYSQLIEPPLGCTSDQISLALKAIDTCESTITDITASLKCISSQITKNSSQSWNVFLKNTAQNSDVVIFWTFDNCSINLENHGNFNRTYLLWPAESYLTQKIKSSHQVKKSTKRNEYRQQNLQKISKNIQTDQLLAVDSLNDPNFSCPQWKFTQVKNILTGCDISGNNRAAECIVERIRDQLSQNWDVLVATSLQADANWYYFNGCSLQVIFGAYGRRIYLWKATE